MTDIYSKLSKARYKYFELADFLIPAMDCLRNHGLVTVTVFTEDFATMFVHEIEGKGKLAITSPMINATYHQQKAGNDGLVNTVDVQQGAMLKGCHPIQNLGAVQTYQRRYLWVSLMEVLEHDALDATTGADKSTAEVREFKKPNKTQPEKKATPKKAEAPKEVPEDDPKLVIESDKDAAGVVDMLLQFAEGMHSHSTDALADYWRVNTHIINKLKDEFPAEYERVKNKFTELREAAEEKQDD
jgi:hypothetical protein